MIFKNLRLKNFKSHVNTSVDFNRGITLIVGSNGAGKSSIFEAITFALFKQSTVNNSDLVRTTKAKEGKIEMSVELTFTSFSEDYKILRTVKKNVATGKSSSSAMLYKVTDTRDEVIASGVREVDREIEQILSMDSNTFLNAIHVRQGEISDLIDKTPAERKELIGRLLKLEDLENAYKRLPGIMKEKTSKKDTLNGRIKNPEELEGELSQLNENRKKITQQIEVFSKQLEDIKLLEEEKSREKDRLDQLKIDYNNLNISFAHERENLVKLNSQKEELNGKMSQILEDEKQMAALKPEAERLETVKEFKENHIELTSLKKDENTKNEILTNISDNKKILEREKENHDKYLILKDEITQLKLTQTELSSEIKHAKSLEDKQKTITADIDRFSKKTDRFEDLTRDILKDFDTEIDSLKTDDELAELEKTVDELIAKKEDEISKIDAEITELRDEKARLAQQSESLKEPLEDIRKVENRCPTCQSEISEETKNDLINGYESTINNNSVRISEIEQSLDSLNDEKKYKNAELKRFSSIKNNTNEHALIISQVGKLTEELAQISEQLKNAQDMKVKLEETEESLGKKTEEFKLLEPNYNEYVKAETLLKSQDEAQIIKDLETLQGQIKAIEENLTILIQKDSELSLDISNDELNAKISDLEAKNSEYLRLTGSVQDKQNQEDKISQNTLEIEAKQKLIEEIENQIKSSEYDEKLHDTIIKEVKKLQDDFNSLFAGIEVNKNELKNIDAQIKTIEDEIKLNNKYLEEYAALCDYLDLLEDFRYFYSKDGVQKDLRSQSRPLIQKYTRDFFEKFNFNYSDLILSDEYDIAIHGPEGEVKLDMVSGGEKIAIALSLRLAITQAMSKGSIETILLDEPTIHLDDYRKQELITVLRSMSVIPQMIIVTHDSELEAAADSIIKVNKVEGISKIGE